MNESWIGRWMARWRGRRDAACDGVTWMIRAAGPITVVCGGMVRPCTCIWMWVMRMYIMHEWGAGGVVGLREGLCRCMGARRVVYESVVGLRWAAVGRWN